MNAERYQQIDDILRRAFELDGEERACYLASACGGDESLRRAVEARIKCDQSLGDFLEASPAEKVFEVLAGGRSELVAGKMINHFKVEGFLGEGGGGARVYKALDTKLGRHVALKLLPGELLEDSELHRRFELEARAASTLSHHNVCTIHEVGETQDGCHYIVMEYVEGETLRQRLSEGPMELREAVDVAAQVASALAAAHEKGVVHRDVKPANIMLRRDGVVKVLDFGLVKLARPEGVSSVGPAAAEMALVTTEPGLLMGTPAYMSPEQTRGRDVDARTDVWGLGCVLYEMVAGHLPFDGETVNDMIVSILRDDGGPPPLTEYSPDAPAELQRIVKKALAKDKEERYQSMKEMALDLQRLRGELDGGVSDNAPAAKRGEPAVGRVRLVKVLAGARRAGSPRLVLIVLAALGLGAAAYLGFVKPAPPPGVRTLAVLPFRPVVASNRDESVELGMADTLIVRLSGLEGISVRPISAVRWYNGLEQDPVEAGRELSVDAVLCGTIQQAGSHVRVSARLVRVSDARTLWVNTFDEEFTDIFAIQDSISMQVASSLASNLAGGRKEALTKHPTDDLEAYRLFLRGRYYFNQRGSDNLNKSISFLERAIARDANFALAHAALADTYNVISTYGVMRPNESFPRAKAAALNAIKLDDTLAEAHAVLAKVMASYDWDWAGAEKEFRRTFELNPNYADGHYFYALNYLLPVGRLDDALREMKRAQELDPSSTIIKTNVGLIYYHMRQYDRAIEQYQQVLSLERKNETARLRLIDCYEQKGMYKEALAEREKIIEPNGSASPERFALLKSAFDSDPKGDVYLRKTFELEKQRAEQAEEYVPPTAVAKRAARIGEKEEAFVWLEKAFPERDGGLTRLGVEPQYDRIRPDPRYRTLLRLVYAGNVPPGVELLSKQFQAY
jgi:TolB-like protein/Tfp pilus assembly protein PilF